MKNKTDFGKFYVAENGNIIDKQEAAQTIADKNPARKRKKVVHKSILKKKRTKSEKRDYVNKKRLYSLMCAWQKINRTMNKLVYRIEHRQMSDKIMNANVEELKTKSGLLKNVSDELMLNYYKIGQGYIKTSNFRNYSYMHQQDMIHEAVERALNIGKKGNKNYGTPYFARYNVKKYNNVLSFFTQQIGNFWLQNLKKHYNYQEEKQVTLHTIIDNFQQQCQAIGVKGVHMNLGDVTES